MVVGHVAPPGLSNQDDQRQGVWRWQQWPSIPVRNPSGGRVLRAMCNVQCGPTKKTVTMKTLPWWPRCCCCC